MTITRRWQTGFETGSADEFTGGYANIFTATKRSGFRANQLDTGTGGRLNFYQMIVGTRQLRTACATIFGDFQTLDGEILGVGADSTRLLEIRNDVATDNIRLIIAGSQEDITADSPLTTGTWFHFGIDCKIDAVSGWVKVYLNGAEILSFAGNTGNIDTNKVTFGSFTDVGSSAYWVYDDCYIDDTTGESSAVPCPILRFGYLFPNADGNYSQWVGSDGNQVENYKLVDERPPSSSDYVEVSGVDLLDSYGMTTVTLGEGQIFEAMIPIGYAQRYNVSGEVAIGTRYSSTDVIGSDTDPGFGAWDFVWDRQVTKPGGGAWDQASVDAVEAVIKSRGNF